MDDDSFGVQRVSRQNEESGTVLGHLVLTHPDTLGQLRLRANNYVSLEWKAKEGNVLQLPTETVISTPCFVVASTKVARDAVALSMQLYDALEFCHGDRANLTIYTPSTDEEVVNFIQKARPQAKFPQASVLTCTFAGSTRNLHSSFQHDTLRPSMQMRAVQRQYMGAQMRVGDVLCLELDNAVQQVYVDELCSYNGDIMMKDAYYGAFHLESDTDVQFVSFKSSKLFKRLNVRPIPIELPKLVYPHGDTPSTFSGHPFECVTPQKAALNDFFACVSQQGWIENVSSAKHLHVIQLSGSEGVGKSHVLQVAQEQTKQTSVDVVLCYSALQQDQRAIISDVHRAQRKAGCVVWLYDVADDIQDDIGEERKRSSLETLLDDLSAYVDEHYPVCVVVESRQELDLCCRTKPHWTRQVQIQVKVPSMAELVYIMLPVVKNAVQRARICPVLLGLSEVQCQVLCTTTEKLIKSPTDIVKGQQNMPSKALYGQNSQYMSESADNDATYLLSTVLPVYLAIPGLVTLTERICALSNQQTAKDFIQIVTSMVQDETFNYERVCILAQEQLSKKQSASVFLAPPSLSVSLDSTLLQYDKETNWTETMTALQSSIQNRLFQHTLCPRAVRAQLAMMHRAWTSGSGKESQGMLFLGPSGSGKTFLCQAFCKETGLRVLQVACADVFQRYLGESEAQIRRQFADARALAPCIIVQDDLDALAANRDAGASGVESRVLTTLLNELDGVEQREQLFVVGLVRDPKKVDAAIMRPGRLEVVVHTTMPTQDDVAEMINTTTNGKLIPELHPMFRKFSTETPSTQQVIMNTAHRLASKGWEVVSKAHKILQKLSQVYLNDIQTL